MFTSKTTSSKKAKKQARRSAEISELDLFAKDARSKYDVLVKLRERVTSEKKIADLDEQIKDHVHVHEVKALLKFNREPVIANNVTFGKINTKDEPTQYGFTCIISKRGDTEIFPVDSAHDITPFATAKSMVTSGSLIQSYKSSSRKFLASEMARIESAKSDAMASALKVAASVGDEADVMIDEVDGVEALMAMFKSMA